MVEELLALVVEDDPLVREIIECNLPMDGWRVISVGSGQEALELLATTTPDVVVLDLLLSDVNGLDLCQHLRSSPEERLANLPVLMLTALAMQADKLAGFSAGADDYLTKPFDPRELDARLKALVKRIGRNNNPTDLESVSLGPLELNWKMRSVRCNTQLLELKPQEFDLISTLVQQPGRVFSREELLKEVWNYQAAVDSRTVDVHVSNLRHKLTAAGVNGSKFIITVHGVGYKMEAPI